MGPVSRRRAILLLLAGSVVFGLVGWRARREAKSLAKRREALSLPGWPNELDGLNVGVLADLHAGGSPVDERHLRRVVRALNDLRPDLVIVAGDLVDSDALVGDEVPPVAVAAALRGLHAPLGTFAVLGDHDRRVDGERVARAATGVGISVLENDSAAVEVRGARLWIAGFSDVSTAWPRIDATLREIPGDAPVIGLTHSPDLFPNVPERVRLTVAGHTHGGQLNVPLLRRVLTPSRFGTRYAEGHIEERGRHLFVAKGIGASKLPLRLLARPEVTVLQLRSEGA